MKENGVRHSDPEEGSVFESVQTLLHHPAINYFIRLLAPRPNPLRIHRSGLTWRTALALPFQNSRLYQGDKKKAFCKVRQKNLAPAGRSAFSDVSNTKRRRGKRTELWDDLTKNRRYWNMKEEAPDHLR